MPDGSTKSRTAPEPIMFAAVEQAHPNALRLALYQATGDAALAQMKLERRPIWGGTYYQDSLTDADRQLVREKALAFLQSGEHLNSGQVPNAQPDDAALRHLMEVFGGGPVNDLALEIGKEELRVGTFPRGVEWEREPSEDTKRAFPVLVIGAGAAGLTAAIQLGRLGIPYTVLERNADVGGTWLINNYPDCRVDIASHNYQLSYMQNYPWSHYFATQPELLDYHRAIADRYDLRPHIRFEVEVISARWEEDASRWCVETRAADGAVENLYFRAVISCAGIFNQPNLPDIPGIETFAGRMFHSTDWDHTYDWSSKRIALLGVGSTGAQMMPRLAKDAAYVAVYQRSPQWVGQRDRYREAVSAEIQWLFDNMPHYWNWYCYSLYQSFFDVNGLQTFDREWQARGGSVSERNDALRGHLEAYVQAKVGHVPGLAAKLTPDFPPMAKRLIADNGWYDALLQPHVELVTDAIDRVSPRGIVTKDGVERPADLIVVCTGFKADRYLWPVQYVGRNGRTLEEAWEKDGARAYLGMTIPGFPNFFTIYGPNAQARAGGVMGWLEIWVRYSVKSIAMMIERGIRSVDCRQDVHDDYNARMDRELEDCIWSAPAHKSYYINEHGRQNTNMPWHPRDYYAWVRMPNFDDFDLR